MSVLLFTTMSWPFSAQLAGAFAACGTRVEALSPPHAKLARSRYIARHHAWRLLTPRASLEHAIAAAKPDLVIPCDDMAAELLAARDGKAPLSRAEFLTRAAQAGAPAAETLALETAGALETAIARFGLPLVIKCDATWGGDGVVIAYTREEARNAFKNFREPSRLRNLVRAAKRRRAYFLSRALFPVRTHISAQRFIAGMPATSALACWNGQLVAAHHFDVTQTSGATGPASVVTRRDCPQMQASATTIARAFNLSGLFGLDYIRGADGQVHLLEMNARAVPTSHLALVADPAFALSQAAGMKPRSRRPTTTLDHIALFPREWLRDSASPWLKSAFHDVPWDDPAVVRACAQTAPDAAKAVLEASAGVPLTAKARFSAPR